MGKFRDVSNFMFCLFQQSCTNFTSEKLIKCPQTLFLPVDWRDFWSLIDSIGLIPTHEKRFMYFNLVAALPSISFPDFLAATRNEELFFAELSWSAFCNCVWSRFQKVLEVTLAPFSNFPHLVLNVKREKSNISYLLSSMNLSCVTRVIELSLIGKLSWTRAMSRNYRASSSTIIHTELVWE